MGERQGASRTRVDNGPRGGGQSPETLGKTIGPGVIAKANEMGVELPAELTEPGAELAPGMIVPFLRDVAGHFFPLLAEANGQD